MRIWADCPIKIVETLIKTDKIMKRRNLISRTAICLYLVLATLLFASCESNKIPEAPYIVKEMESCEKCKAKYKYKIVSLNTPTRHTYIITNDLFLVGDTLRISK